MALVRAHAHARAGLIGNPSDLYGGCGIGFAFEDFGAEVELAPAGECRFPSPLIDAAWRALADPELPPCRARFRCDVPRQAGLSGSSAIVLAALRAFAAFYGYSLPPGRLAELAWKAENELLGIRSGPMDRLIQAHGGLIWMDFARPFAPEAVEVLDPALLPPLRVAWDPAPGRPSGAVHDEVWDRWQAGDAAVRNALAGFRPLAQRALAALETGDYGELKACVSDNFDLRAAVFPIGARDRRLIAIGREHGAATKFCGSGGAALVVMDGTEDRNAIEAAYRAEGFDCREPRRAGRPRPGEAWSAAGQWVDAEVPA